MREKGIHILDGFPCFMTNSFQEEDLARIKTVMLTSVNELVSSGFLNSQSSFIKSDTQNKETKTSIDKLNTPPVKGAKLGMDENGNPAWFVMDEKKSGEYYKIDL
jgi:hypothetical protein